MRACVFVLARERERELPLHKQKYVHNVYALREPINESIPSLFFLLVISLMNPAQSLDHNGELKARQSSSNAIIPRPLKATSGKKWISYSEEDSSTCTTKADKRRKEMQEFLRLGE